MDYLTNSWEMQQDFKPHIFKLARLRPKGKKYACHIQKPPSANGVQKGCSFFAGFLNQATTGA